MQNNQSYFHKINNKLTINLAAVSSAFDQTEHVTSLLKMPDHAEWAGEMLASGHTCLVSIRPERTGGIQPPGRTFRITRAEMTTLQDALEWYNRHFARTEQQ